MSGLYIALANAVWFFNRRLEWECLYSLDGWLLSCAVRARKGAA